MITRKLKIAIMVSVTALTITPVTLAKGFSSSGGRSSSVSSSRSYSAPKTFTRTSSAKPIYKKYTPVNPPVSSTRTVYRSSGGEYEYFALNDCKRVVKPINGYRCFDRD